MGWRQDRTSNHRFLGRAHCFDNVVVAEFQVVVAEHARIKSLKTLLNDLIWYFSIFRDIERPQGDPSSFSTILDAEGKFLTPQIHFSIYRT